MILGAVEVYLLTFSVVWAEFRFFTRQVLTNVNNDKLFLLVFAVTVKFVFNNGIISERRILCH